MSRTPAQPRDELIHAVLKACEILRAFHYEGESLRLRDLVDRTGLGKSTTHRLIRSLEQGGLLKRVGAESYVPAFQPIRRVRPRIGLATQMSDSTFSQAVTESIRQVAATQDLELLVVNNRYSPKVALRNAEHLIRERVELVLEFQTYENIAPIIAARFAEAGIPLIAIEIPHPGAIYFGANNYQAGLIGGRALGRWATQHWDGKVDEILLLEERVAGPLPRSRVTGMIAGVREVLPDVERIPVTTYNGRGQFPHSLEVVRQHLKRTPPRRVLVAANNDPSALGALRGFEEAGREQQCAIMGQNAILEAREEMRRKGTGLVGSVAYYPERYGDELIPLALAVIDGKPTPSAVYVKHLLVTPANVDQVYPLDGYDPNRLRGLD
jgi:ribose transport system substrate-binding protein